MAQITYRGNLSASRFPFVSHYQGRSVIIDGPDQSYVRGLQTAQDGLIDEASRGIPQITYCHNVMPSTEGFQSVKYTSRVGAIGAVTDIQQIIQVSTVDFFNIIQTTYLTWSQAANAWYRLDQSGGVWNWAVVGVTGISDFGGTAKVSVATVNGVSYILLYTSAQICRVYDPTLNQLNTVALTGTATAFPAGIIAGNLSCFGYHILWDQYTIAWSSTTTPTDFTPSPITGAGYSRVEGARGMIVAVVPHQLGFIIFTTRNAVAGIYTGNARYPFQYKEITGVGGMPDFYYTTNGAYNLISDDPNTQSQFAYTSSGLQLINSSSLQVVHSDITDFISGNYLEDFNTTTRLFTRTLLTQQLLKGINVVSDRYLVISYGIAGFTHALVYDIETKRMGKLKFSHAGCLTFNNVVATGTTITLSTGPRGNLGFFLNTGAIYTVDFDSADSSAIANDSVIMIGKFQHSRNHLIQMEQIDFENIPLNANCVGYMYTSLDGKNPELGADTAVGPALLSIRSAANNLVTYNAHRVGINHTLVWIGRFYATSIVIKYNQHGRR